MTNATDAAASRRKPRVLLIVVALIALLALSTALTGCAGGGSQSADQSGGGTDAANATGASAAGGDLQKLTFVLDYTPNTNHTGIYVAQALGYYAEEGLEVAVVQPPEDGADALVASGNAQLGMSYQDIMANYLGSDEPLPVTAVAAVVQHNTSGIMSPAEQNITRPAAMEGKRYATWDQDVEKAMVRTVVEADGGNFDAVQLIPAGYTDEVSGLRADQFDTIWGYEGWAIQNAKVQDYPVNYFSFRSIDERFDYYTPVIIANDAFLQSDPEAVRAFLRATERGYIYAAEHPEEAAEILVEAVPELDPELIAASQAFLADQYAADAPQWGYFDADRWNAFYRWMNEEGLTETAVPLDTAFTNEYLPGQGSE